MTKLDDTLVGTVSKKGETALTIADAALNLFEVGGVTYADWFEEGVSVTMQLGYGQSAMDVEILRFSAEFWVRPETSWNLICVATYKLYLMKRCGYT